MFWHFGSKAALFKEACKRFFIPFWREVERSLESLGPRERVLALFDMYEEFTTNNRETIQALVRWVLESPTMRESLRGELLSLHAHVHRRPAPGDHRAVGRRHRGDIATTALSSILAGNLLFSVIDPGLAQDSGRSHSLRAVAERMLFSFAHPRERVGNA